MNIIKPKKKFGQHFLKDKNIACKIVENLSSVVPDVLEVGPGSGILTGFLLQRPGLNVHLVEIDHESVEFLRSRFPGLRSRLSHANFLEWEPDKINGSFSIIGNFPYNISSQIFFRILKLRDRIPEVVGMVQKEVAERINASPGNKTYGILSVLISAFYDTEYLFTVSQNVFIPPPKVQSAVIRLKRNNKDRLSCDEKLFFALVKKAFGQRRKMLRNSLKEKGVELPVPLAEKRPEQLSVEDFIELTNIIEKQKNL